MGIPRWTQCTANSMEFGARIREDDTEFRKEFCALERRPIRTPTPVECPRAHVPPIPHHFTSICNDCTHQRCSSLPSRPLDRDFLSTSRLGLLPALELERCRVQRSKGGSLTTSPCRYRCVMVATLLSPSTKAEKVGDRSQTAARPSSESARLAA